jgi:hypothetical protein
MSCATCPPDIEKIGANPSNIQWCVVRGDTATLRIDFVEDDEVTYLDTSTWSYDATAYDPSTDISFTLTTEDEPGYVLITAPASMTEDWGNIYSSVVAELIFDLQVTIPSDLIGGLDTIWTPVIGTISVLGDVTLGGSL